jgi:hypothetical protein
LSDSSAPPPRFGRRAFLGALLAGAGVAAVVRSCREPAPLQGSAHAYAAVFGQPGTFGGLSQTVNGVLPVPVSSWRFGAGQANSGAVVTEDGTVLLATTPLSDDQTKPTGDGMEIGVFRPDSGFRRLVIPSSTGSATQPGSNPAARGVGGGDVAALQPYHVGTKQRVAFVAMTAYNGWDVSRYGLLPTFGKLHHSGGWRYDEQSSRTADQLAAAAPVQVRDRAFPTRSDRPRDPLGPGTIAQLPRSGRFIVGQYFGATAADPGALLVLDQAGVTQAWWPYPPVTVFGNPVLCRPRAIVVDPTSQFGDERFVVVFDCYNSSGGVVPFVLQEFAYDARKGPVDAIVPRSTGVVTANDGSRMETAAFDAAGTLFVARTASDGFDARPLAVYRKVNGERSLVRNTPAGLNWPSLSWGSASPPDEYVDGTDVSELVRSITVDPVTGAVLLAGVGGTLVVVSPQQGRYAVTARRNLHVDLLRLGAPHHVGIRQGTIDARRRLLWLPVSQVVLGDLQWPYPPMHVPQWLYAVDLRRLLGR